MSISIIAAIGKNRELGRNNDLIWHFKEDMKFFKETTTGGTVIMGRKTFESLPKALPNRQNIVITSDAEYKADGAELAHSVDDALKKASCEKIFIIGGARVYAETVALCDSIYLTEIDAQCDDADVFFPQFEKNNYYAEKLAEYTVDGIHFSHILYKREKSI